MQKYTLVITEKPSTALKVAASLADSGFQKVSSGKVPYYTLQHKGKPMVVVPAAGHLYALAPTSKGEGTRFSTWPGFPPTRRASPLTSPRHT